MTCVSMQEMNSIQNALGANPKGQEAEISLLIKAHYPDGKLLVLVEGRSDREIYSRFYPEEKCDIYFSVKYSGCLGLADVLRSLNKKYSGRLIVIKDADFDHLDNITYPDLPNLFLTDTHDIETMMLTEHYKAQLKEEFNVDGIDEKIKDALNDIIHLSYLKWMNHVECRKINFRDSCNLGSCYNGRNVVSVDKWLNKINTYEKNENKDLFNKEEVCSFESGHSISMDETLQLTCGHDMVDAITLKIHACCRKNVSKRRVGQMLKDNFTEEDYQRTKLYGSIDLWLSSNGYD